MRKKNNLQLNRDLRDPRNGPFDFFMGIIGFVFLPISILVLLSERSKNPRMFVFRGILLGAIGIVILAFLFGNHE